MLRPPRAAESKGGQISGKKILLMKQFHILQLAKFKFLSHIKGYPINNCDF